MPPSCPIPIFLSIFLHLLRHPSCPRRHPVAPSCLPCPSRFFTLLQPLASFKRAGLKLPLAVPIKHSATSQPSSSSASSSPLLSRNDSSPQQ
ncbi:hypothetical protein EJ110_NYTH42803 [Nymphaea thermarum]|nr:hypothetical protein EJ110_NYTH42803 [Nymphaea thermarum]